MWDKLEIRIPFDELQVQETGLVNGHRSGFVPIQNYDFPAMCPVAFVDGEKVYSDPTAQKWGSVASSISALAVGFFPEGNGFHPWPHVCIKASPSKILQGHNVFGTENIRPGAFQMLASLQMAFPKIYAHLAIGLAEVRFLDSTYSAFVESPYHRNTIIKLIEGLFPNKTDISRHVGYVQANKSSEYHRQKVYYKHAELQADLDKAIKTGEHVKAAILSDRRIQEFAYGRLRFEATTGHRALDNLGIPRNLGEFLQFHDWYERTHGEPLCRYLWQKAFKKSFDQLEGHTVKNVDDDNIKLLIDANYITVSDSGRVNKRKANAVFRTYRDIKAEGYDQLARENSSTFFRNVKMLEDIGISRAFLKSLDPQKPNENVVPIVQMIAIDFSAQRPDFYVEPTCGFHDRHRHLRLVA